MLEFLDDIVGGVGDLFGGIKSGIGSLFDFIPKEAVGPSITAIGGLTHGLTQPSPQMAYGNTQAGFEAQMAFEREKLAQAMEIAKMNAGGAGAGAGAAKYAANLQYQAAMAQLREKALADALAAQMQSTETNLAARQKAIEQLVNAAQASGSLGSQAYGRGAQFLQGFRL